MNFHLISAILKSVWAIDPQAALSYAPLLSNLLGQSAIKTEFDFTGKEFDPFFVNKSSVIFSFNDEADNKGSDNSNNGNVAVIPIKGPLMKEDQYCGPIGMATIGQMIKDVDALKNVDAILLHIDSPGGTVDGTVALAEIVKNTKKPTIAFIDGLGASAALWIASAADEVIAADNKTELGSVGVVLSFADLQPAYEKLGVKFHHIVSDQSKDKNKTFEDIRNGKYDDFKKEILNPLADDFINSIKSNRPGVNENQLTGKMFFAENLKGTLIDSIGNFDYAAKRAFELSEERNSNNSKNNNSNSAKMENFKSINKTIGEDKLESTDDGIFLNEDQLEKINSALEKVEQDSNALQTATDEKKVAEDSLVDANQTIESQKTEIEDLKKNPGADTAKAVTEQDKINESGKDKNVTSEDKSFMENLEAVEKEFA
jgi:protease-4